ncbi:MAG: hypothetical protein KGD58_14955 [Candidatus Lokiarchaeota archaeon]|nr:hypothetical protein [Candidatus Lokiarchaeota archaeon]
MEQISLKKLFIWILLSINLLFAYIIGLSVPQLETTSGYIFGFVMIPLLIILNYIILDRFHFYTKKVYHKEEKTSAREVKDVNTIPEN